MRTVTRSIAVSYFTSTFAWDCELLYIRESIIVNFRQYFPYRNIDLPGCDPADLDIQIVDDTLVIKAERSHVHSKDTDTVHTMERSFGQVSRTIKLPKDANLDDVKTDFNFGVLNVTFAKKLGVTMGRKLQIN